MSTVSCTFSSQELCKEGGKNTRTHTYTRAVPVWVRAHGGVPVQHTKIAHLLLPKGLSMLSHPLVLVLSCLDRERVPQSLCLHAQNSSKIEKEGF